MRIRIAALAIAFGWLSNGMCADSPSPDVIVVELRPEQGILGEMLTREAKRAKELKRIPFVQLTSSACAACDVLTSSLTNDDVKETLAGAYIIKLDTAVWRNHLRPRGFDTRDLPRFYLINAAGEPVGRTLLGNTWVGVPHAQLLSELKYFFKTEQKAK
jgi:hypothetical protein